MPLVPPNDANDRMALLIDRIIADPKAAKAALAAHDAREREIEAKIEQLVQAEARGRVHLADIAKAQADLADRQVTVEAGERDLAASKARHDQDCDQLRAARGDHDTAVAVWRGHVAAAKREAEATEARVKALDERQAALTVSEDQLAIARKALGEEVAEHDRQKADLKRSADALRSAAQQVAA